MYIVFTLNYMQFKEQIISEKNKIRRDQSTNKIIISDSYLDTLFKNLHVKMASHLTPLFIT